MSNLPRHMGLSARLVASSNGARHQNILWSKIAVLADVQSERVRLYERLSMCLSGPSRVRRRIFAEQRHSEAALTYFGARAQR